MRNFFKRKLPNLLLSFILIFSMLMPEAAFAGSRSVPMYLTVTEEPIEFNISETITMTGTEGNTDLTISPVAISNIGKKDMTVSSMAITTEGGYTLVSTASNFTTASATSVGISCKDHEFSSGAYEPYDDVLVGGSISYTLKGKISSMATASTETAAKMVVTLEKAVPGYVLYESGSTGSSFSITFPSGAYNGTMEYSNNGVSWQTVTQGTAISSKNGKLYLRGTGNTYCTGGRDTNIYLYTNNANIKKVSGNIESLLDYKKAKAGEHPAMGSYAFTDMFRSSGIGLTDASELQLPATTLANSCYYEMFSGCTRLTKAPSLPATTLAERCYYEMFYGCTSLTTAPNLPATTLANSCYYEMFSGCTSLTTPPELPATNLANYCYYAMFKGCARLTKAPSLPVTTLADNCYGGMFWNCTSLTTAPELPATSLASNCYSHMFYGCTRLTTPPSLPATTLARSCYNLMFGGCTSLTTPPELPATSLADSCYYQMFTGCTNIKLSETKTGEYTTPYRVPTSGTGTTASYALSYMFKNTGGTFKGDPSINTTYYLASN